MSLERVKGIEPSYEAWEAAVLPLNYTRSSAGVYGSCPLSGACRVAVEGMQYARANSRGRVKTSDSPPSPFHVLAPAHV